tara:strand:+ start:67 stop:540 length:474 start_codon:yes stop_codon:yes gene_type:complete
LVKASAFVIYVLPIILSVSLGTAVMAETLSSSDRELNFLQFGDGKSHSSSSTDGLSLIGLNSEIAQNSNLEFSLNFSDSNFNCGDLYITIYDVTSGKDVLTQSGYLKQCFIQNNNILPVDDTFSELIIKPGTYEIYIEIFNEKYSESVSITETFRVK